MTDDVIETLLVCIASLPLIVLLGAIAYAEIKKAETEIKKTEKVNHPAHYNIPGRKECIEEMLDKFGVDKVMNFCEVNIYKYEYRYQLKGGLEDLQKADWYRQKLAELGKQKWDKYINDK